MLLLRAGFLELLICLHVVGGAVLFRRLFPRESPWLGFLVPITAVTAALNFFEHFVSLPWLGWLLPFTLGGIIWTLVRPGYSWEGLRFPTGMFIFLFTAMFLLRCIAPNVLNYTEDGVDLKRILDYSLGDTVPSTDSWLPPYDSGGYYSFQHYGASIVKRLFSVDIGTAHNLSFALLLALLGQMGVGAAYVISGKRWIACATVIVLMAGSTGASPILLLMGNVDYALTTALNSSWDGSDGRNPFAWLCKHDAYHPDITMVAPTYTIYCHEFHANIGATFLTMGIVLATLEAFRAGRYQWPWICLLVLPAVVIVTSAWYFLIALFYCVGGLVIAYAVGRRPQDWRVVAIAAAVGLIFIWPSFVSLSANPYAQGFVLNKWEDHVPFWMFFLQWWPLFIPWLLLFLFWKEIGPMGWWFQISIPIVFISMEFVSLSARAFTVQKMWGDLYGIGLITILPLLFVQRTYFLRAVSALVILAFAYSLTMWIKICYYDGLDTSSFCQLSGDHGIVEDTQRRRILHTLERLHGETVLPGKSYWAYNLAPLIVTLSQNRCFVAFTFQEEQYGHGGETNYRCQLNNDFYAGLMTSPLAFLHAYNIAAVVIWPEDEIPDGVLQQIQSEIGSEYFYVNLKGGDPHNAGVFMRQGKTRAATPPGDLYLTKPSF